MSVRGLEGYDLHLVYPQIVPSRGLIWLARAGVYETADVHEHIRNGTLETLRGIGPKRARRITLWYTAGPDWDRAEGETWAHNN